MGIADKNMVSATFWTNLTTERIYGATDNAQAAAGRLQQFVIWVFGIFSTLTFTGVVFAKKEDWSAWALLMLGFSLAMLVYAYWLSIKSTYPFAFSVQVGNEVSEKKAYQDTINEIRKYLSWSFRLCAAGTLFYAAGIFIQFGYPVVAGLGGRVDGDFSIQMKGVAKQRAVSLHIRSKGNAYVSLFLESDTLIDKKKKTVLAFEKNDGLGKVVFVDASGSALVNLRYRPCSNVFLRAEKLDSVKGGGEKRTILRLLVFKAAVKADTKKKTDAAALLKR